MRLKFLVLSLALIIVISACSKKDEQKQPQALAKAKSTVHQVVVQESIQVSGYTYLKVKEGEKEYWLAGTTMDVKK